VWGLQSMFRMDEIWSMKIGFIGYGDHAKRLASLLDTCEPNNMVLYHPFKQAPNMTNDARSLFDCDAVFVTSPNDTHYEYVKWLAKESDCYIFCEKPPATTHDQISILGRYNAKLKSRIFFNFNYRFSKLAEILQNISADDEFGSVMLINAAISHGLAFKDGYASTWRGGYDLSKSVVLDTSLIHLIDLVQYTYRSKGMLSLKGCQSSSFAHGSDTFSMTLANTVGMTVNLFGSYAAPYQLRLSVTGTNGLAEIDRYGFRVYAPRDTFDANGLFTHPPEQIRGGYNFEDDYIQSLKSSLMYFMENVKAKCDLSINHYDASLETMRLLMQVP
jgi:predicted dehydrogenase